MRNPYVCGGWVAGSRFYGRHRLVQSVVSGRFAALYVMGGRRSGKTSLLRRIEEECIREHVPCLLLDLQATGRTVDGLFRSLRVELGSKARHWPHLLSADLLAAPDLHALVAELLDRVEVVGARVLLLLDEAEVLLEMARSSPEILTSLQEMRCRCPSLVIVVAASRSLLLMVQSSSSKLSPATWSGFQVRYLTHLDNGAAGELIQQRQSSVPVRVAPLLVQQIKEAAGCQPYYLQLLCHRLYQSDHSLRPLAESDLEVDDLLETLFHSDYQNLLAEERELLWLVLDRSGQGIDALKLSAGLDDVDLMNHLYWLGCLGYVRRRRKRIFVANRFLASWLRSYREGLRDARAADTGSGPLIRELHLPAT